MANLTAAVDGVEIKLAVVREAWTWHAQLSGWFSQARRPVRVVRRRSSPSRTTGRAAAAAAGVVLRLRRNGDGSGRSTLKRRAAEEQRFAGDWAASARGGDDYRVEYDWANTPDARRERRSGRRQGGRRHHHRGHPHHLFSHVPRPLLAHPASASRGARPPLEVSWRDLRFAEPIEPMRWRDVEVGPFTGEKLCAPGDGAAAGRRSWRCPEPPR